MILRDYSCERCSVTLRDVATPTKEEAELHGAVYPAPPPCCPECGHLMYLEMGYGYAKLIVRGNHDYSQRERERLTRRSDEHFKREGRDEAIERQRMQLKREGYVP